MVSDESFHHFTIHLYGKIASHVAVCKHSVCIIQYAKTKVHEWNAHEISYKMIPFPFSLDKQILTY